MQESDLVLEFWVNRILLKNSSAFHGKYFWKCKAVFLD